MTSHLAAVLRLVQQRAVVELVDAWRAADIPSMIIKGEATFAALYERGEVRPTADIDLLIPASQSAAAQTVLVELGWLPERQLRPGEGARHSSNWRAVRDGVAVHLDLHTSFHGVRTGGDSAWDIWSRDAVPLSLGSFSVPGPAPATTALIVAVHRTRALETSAAATDLRRALSIFDDGVWQDASQQARLLGCEHAMAAGLREEPEGVALAARLCLPEPDLTERLDQRRVDPLAGSLLRAVHVRGVRARTRLLLGEAFPTRDFLQLVHPYTQRGRVWRLAGRGHRLLSLLYRLPTAVLTLRRERRRAAEGRG